MSAVKMCDATTSWAFSYLICVLVVVAAVHAMTDAFNPSAIGVRFEIS
jgi:hypothetical protein